MLFLLCYFIFITLWLALLGWIGIVRPLAFQIIVTVVRVQVMIRCIWAVKLNLTALLAPKGLLEVLSTHWVVERIRELLLHDSVASS